MIIKLLLFGLLCYVLYRVVSGSGGVPGVNSKRNAYRILGLSEGASVDQINEAHRRLIAKVHPDSGGSSELAAKVNEARDTLLKTISQ
jgi:preprotein translocase subunit Sec63